MGNSLVSQKTCTKTKNKSSNDCPIKGASEPLRDIFVSRVVRSSTSESLQTYLQSNGIKVREVKQISHIDSKFKSFKVSIDKSSYSDVFNKELWNSGVNVCKYKDYTKNTNNG